jgi:predicted CXXCH cytochrome family protein
MMHCRDYALATLLATGLVLQPVAASSSQPCEGAGPSSASSDAHSCLECHDGTLAFDMHVAAPEFSSGYQSGEHPIMVSYNEVYSRKPQQYILPAMLDPRIELVNGKVQCVSCHASGGAGRWTLVKSNNGSALCLSCHRI